MACGLTTKPSDQLTTECPSNKPNTIYILLCIQAELRISGSLDIIELMIEKNIFITVFLE